MPWIVGIDEAGYGPNLGPLVMTSVACRIPPSLAGADFWQLCRPAVRRHFEPADGRLLVEDSKLIYSTSRGLHDLETAVLAILAPAQNGTGFCLAHLIDQLSPACHADLHLEPWYLGTSGLPVAAEPAGLQEAADRFEGPSREHQLQWGLVRSVVVCPARFNRLLDQWGTKGAVLGQALTELLACNRPLEAEAEPVWYFIDKHGGRNTYAPMLQNALPDGMVVAHEEGLNRSVYSVLGLGQEVRLTFQPRADAEHFCVALASMVSKYLRELLMLEFNRFWQDRVPGLKPTAGYPGDAARFFAAIRPAAERLGIADAVLWRRK
jgi:hypothetical protein